MSEIEFDLRGPSSGDPVPAGLRVLSGGGASKRDPYFAHDEGAIALETLRRVLRLEKIRRRRNALREMLRSLRELPAPSSNSQPAKVVPITAVIPFKRNKPRLG